MRLLLPLVTLSCVVACDRAPNYNAGVPGGRSAPIDPDAAPRAPAAPSAPTEAKVAAASGSQAAAPVAPAAKVVIEEASRGEGLVAPPKQYDTPSEAPPTAPSSGVVSPPTNSPEGPAAPSIDRVREHAATKRFDEIRGMSRRFREIQRELRVLGERLSQGVTEADRARYIRLETDAESEWPRLRSYMWDERWSEFDRAAMGIIIYGD